MMSSADEPHCSPGGAAVIFRKRASKFLLAAALCVLIAHCFSRDATWILPAGQIRQPLSVWRKRSQHAHTASCTPRHRSGASPASMRSQMQATCSGTYL